MELIPDLGYWKNSLACLGLFYAGKTAAGWLGDMYAGWRAYVLPRLCRSEHFGERFGEWAVVTGCTGGIGREYALGLAKKGMSMVLVSRSKEKLEELENEILKLYKVKTMIIVVDFTEKEALDQLVITLRESKIDIGVLVNNVGMLGPHFQPFLDLESKIVADMIQVNVTATTVLCHELLPAMIQKRKGAVINIASISSYMPGAYLAEYTATKHYVHALTEAISIEIAGTGVIVQEVNPGPVDTEMTKHFAPGPGKPPADVYVASALAALGYSQRTLGYWLFIELSISFKGS